MRSEADASVKEPPIPVMVWKVFPGNRVMTALFPRLKDFGFFYQETSAIAHQDNHETKKCI